MERSLQELVWQRAGHRCEYCQVPQERDRLPFEIDHIIAENHDGIAKVSNLCLRCFACNRHKGAEHRRHRSQDRKNETPR